MPVLEAPELLELEQLCDFARMRLEQLQAGGPDQDDDPPTEWEWGCLHKTKAWLLALSEITPQQEIAMALAVIKKHHVLPNIRGLLDLWTGHLKESTRQLWADGAFAEVLIYTPDEYGWWLWSGTDECPPPETVPEDIRAAMTLAKNLGCDWIKFDADASPIELLPTYTTD